MANVDRKEQLVSDDVGYIAWYATSLRLERDVIVPRIPPDSRVDLEPLLVHVERNFPFEFLQRPLQKAATLWGRDLQFELSGYDISVPTPRPQGSRACTLFWVDWRLLLQQSKASSLDVALRWMETRCKSIALGSELPVLINDWPLADDAPADWTWQIARSLSSLCAQHANVWKIELSDLLKGVPLTDWYDQRNDFVAKYPFSQRATTTIANHLGLDVLARASGQDIRALILDADDTLYGGTLGEEGAHGVLLTEGHRSLQAHLRALKDRGMILTTLSRNEHGDVKELFDERADFPLRWNDFAFHQISWEPKAVGLKRTLEVLNLSAVNVCVVDDNAVELLKLGETAGMKRLLASKDAGETLRSLRRLPGMWNKKGGDLTVGASRTRDIQAKVTRQKLQTVNASESDFLLQLKTELTFSRNRPSEHARIVELSQKTNQFNLSLARLDPAALSKHLQGGGDCLSVQVRDILGDSGLVGMSLVSIDGQQLKILEYCLSCRALGRHVEDFFLRHLLRWAQLRGATRVTTRITHGPRNDPALIWANKRGLSLRSIAIEDVEERTSKGLHHFPITVSGEF